MWTLLRLISAAVLITLHACSEKPVPVCFPEGEANVARGAGETAALADARRRSADCGREGLQCRFEVATSASAEIWVHVLVETFDPSTRQCLAAVDSTRHYEYSAAGVFQGQFRI